MDQLPQAPQPSVWDTIRVIAEAVISLGGAITVVFAVVKGIPMMWDRALMFARLNSAETAAREYRLACEELKQSIMMLEERNADLRAENDSQERAAVDFAVAAGTFIITLTSSLKRLTEKLTAAGISNVEPLPTVPEELTEAVALAHRKQSEKRAQEGASSDTPFSSAPKEGAN